MEYHKLLWGRCPDTSKLEDTAWYVELRTKWMSRLWHRRADNTVTISVLEGNSRSDGQEIPLP